MNTKSTIQLIKESIDLQNNIKDSLRNVMNKYTIEDSIFVWNNGLNECTNGYFEVSNEFENLNEAISNLNIRTQGVRVINNEKFQIGNIYNTLSECSKDKQVLDIKCLENIR